MKPMVPLFQRNSNERRKRDRFKECDPFKEGDSQASLAFYGLKDTIDAVKNGYLELLLVSKGHKQRGWICEKCQLVDSDIKDKCPNCGGKVSEVDVIEEIIEFAERTDTKIEFVDDNRILQELGSVGGLLRFKR